MEMPSGKRGSQPLQSPLASPRRGCFGPRLLPLTSPTHASRGGGGGGLGLKQGRGREKEIDEPLHLLLFHLQPFTPLHFFLVECAEQPTSHCLFFHRHALSLVHFTWTKKIDGFPFERVASLWPSLSSLKHARPSSAATQKTAVPV